MSHFTTVVFIPGDTPPDQIEDKLTTLLEPFDEQIEVPEYDRPCHCLGQMARQAAQSQADAKFGTIDEARAKAQERVTVERATLPPLPEDMDDPAFPELFAEREAMHQRIWEELTGDRFRFIDDFIANHPMKDQPTRDCTECHGTGTYKSTYNPKSKWDWYEIGGRWDGMFDGQNVVKATDLPEDWVPHAIITPDGEWHERGTMGWWAIVTNEKGEQDWNAEAAEIASGHADHYAVLCDLHI